MKKKPSIPRDEAGLKAKLVDRVHSLVPQMVTIQIQNVRHIGQPDITTTANKRTVWWELKHGTPKFDSPGIQELTMKRLARHGFAYYILYLENEERQYTVIVSPDDIGLDWDNPTCWTAYLGSKRYAERFTDGFDHDWVVKQIVATHYDSLESEKNDDQDRTRSSHL